MDNDLRTPAQPLSAEDAAREARRLLADWKPDEETLALVIAVPFIGLAVLATAVGAAIAKAKEATNTTTNVYEGPVTVTHRTEVHSTARGAFARNRNNIHPS